MTAVDKARAQAMAEMERERVYRLRRLMFQTAQQGRRLNGTPVEAIAVEADEP